jgi:7-alpha-hydroxysteroid dehydrogenase
MSDYLSRFRLDDRVAVITGGGKGIGKSIALVFAEAGAHVVIAEVDKDAAEAVAAEVRAQGRKSLPVQVDVTSLEQVKGMVAAALREFKRIDVLVNNVGGPLFPASPLIRMTDELWEGHIKFNLTSAFWCCREAGMVMASQNSGNIINMSSVAGNRPVPGMTAYGINKAAMIQMTRILALELAQYHIRVNGIAPMSILHGDREWGPVSPGMTEQQRARRLGIVVDRVGTVEDISLAALYLASDASSYITGEILDIAGGPLFPADVMERFEENFRENK